MCWPSAGGLQNPIVAFVPIFGLWIVLFESIGRSGFFALIGLVPSVGWLILPVWTGIEIPAHHGRTRWWTAILALPLLCLVGYWAYAFTLPKHVSASEDQALLHGCCCLTCVGHALGHFLGEGLAVRLWRTPRTARGRELAQRLPRVLVVSELAPPQLRKAPHLRGFRLIRTSRFELGTSQSPRLAR